MKRNVLISLLIIVLLFVGVGGQLAERHYASSPTSYGMYEYLANTSLTSAQQPCIDWYINSSFNWIVIPIWTLGYNITTASQLNTSGKRVILETDFQGGNISIYHYNWTDILNSYNGNKTIYNEALTFVTTEINENGAANLYAVTIGEENPDWGYWHVNADINVANFIACHNHLYDDLKALYPSLKVFAAVHIDLLTNNQLATLKRDGIVDDEYNSNQTTMGAWFRRITQVGGAETYCIVHASSNYATWTDLITPSVVRQTEELAESLGVPHLGWFAYDYSTSPPKSILFNNWTACADPNDSHCSGNFKDTLLNIVNTAQPNSTSASTDGLDIEIWAWIVIGFVFVILLVAMLR